MSAEFQIALALLLTYLVGSVPTAYLFGRIIKHIDIRDYGSGNVGGSNAWLHVGRRAVVPVVAFDIFVKGSAPIWISRFVLDMPVEAQVGIGLVAIAGHNWSLYLKFTGGRGIATAIGVMLAQVPPNFPLELFTFVVVAGAVFLFSRMTALSILVSLGLLPLLSLAGGRPIMTVLLMIGILGLTVSKRLTGNRKGKVDGVPARKLLLTRLLHDRDTANRDAWVLRRPG